MQIHASDERIHKEELTYNGGIIHLKFLVILKVLFPQIQPFNSLAFAAL